MDGKLLFLTFVYYLRANGINVAGTLQLNEKRVPASVKNKMLKRNESTAAEYGGVMIKKRRDKRNVSLISTFHDNARVTKNTQCKCDICFKTTES
jgi:hypothetical protein